MFWGNKTDRVVSSGKRIERKMVTVWRARTFFGYIVLMLLTTYLFPIRTYIWAGLALLWSFIMLFMYLIYYPIKYNKLSYDVRNDLLIVNCGVLYTRIKAIPVENIQFVTVTASWLMSYLKLHTLIIHGAGGSVHISGIKEADEEELRKKLGVK